MVWYIPSRSSLDAWLQARLGGLQALVSSVPFKTVFPRIDETEPYKFTVEKEGGVFSLALQHPTDKTVYNWIIPMKDQPNGASTGNGKVPSELDSLHITKSLTWEYDAGVASYLFDGQKYESKQFISLQVDEACSGLMRKFCDETYKLEEVKAFMEPYETGMAPGTKSQVPNWWPKIDGTYCNWYHFWQVYKVVTGNVDLDKKQQIRVIALKKYKQEVADPAPTEFFHGFFKFGSAFYNTTNDVTLFKNVYDNRLVHTVQVSKDGPQDQQQIFEYTDLPFKVKLKYNSARAAGGGGASGPTASAAPATKKVKISKKAGGRGGKDTMDMSDLNV